MPDTRIGWAMGGRASSRVAPVSEQGADILCVEEAPGDVTPRIHGRFAIMLVRSPTFVRVESSRSLVGQQLIA